MSPAEWDGLAWWQQQMYVEGYEEEGLIERNDSAQDDALGRVTGVHRSGGSTITDRTVESTLSNQPGEFAAFGIPEHTI